MTHSAGLLLYRRVHESIEVLLVHPGGPLWAKRDDGAWSIPKGEIDDEAADALATARREFQEETGHPAPDGPYLDLGEVRLRSGKVVRAWAAEGDLDPATATSTTFEMPWPPRSGRIATFPEVDRVAWFTPAEASRKLNPAQAPFVEQLLQILSSRPA